MNESKNNFTFKVPELTGKRLKLVVVDLQISRISDDGNALLFHENKSLVIRPAGKALYRNPSMNSLFALLYLPCNTGFARHICQITFNLLTTFSAINLYINTDKEVYKPGQKVLFRILQLDYQLKPTTFKVNKKLTNQIVT